MTSKAGTTATDKPKTDWDAVERQYRAGQLSLRMIAAQAGITEGAIRKKAKAESWKRDLTAKVREAVRTALVRADGTQTPTRVPDPRTDREIVEQAAASAVQVVREHRGMLVRAGSLSRRLFDQLDEATAYREEIEETINKDMDREMAAAGPAERQGIAARRKHMLAAVSLPGHASTLRDLSNAVKNFVTIERQSWGLDASEKVDDAFAGLSDDQLALRRAAIEEQLKAHE